MSDKTLLAFGLGGAVGLAMMYGVWRLHEADMAGYLKAVEAEDFHSAGQLAGRWLETERFLVGPMVPLLAMSTILMLTILSDRAAV